MKIGDVVRFHDEEFFNGAVQLGWALHQIELAQKVAGAFVFHGPRYHGAGGDVRDSMEGAYRLKDTASFVRDLLDSMQSARSGQERNPYRLGVAGYGSGKSHLSVTVAALLSEPKGVTAGRVLAQIRNADAEVGAHVERLIAALDKPVLVLPLDGSSRFHLGTALSQVVFAQLRRAGVDADAIRELSPRFQTAEQFVERNFAFRTDAFAARLPGQEAPAICAALRDHDEDIFDAINEVYTEANGHQIPIEGQESAQALLETLRTVYCAEDGPFSHVLLLFDELGLYLEHAAEHPERAGARVLQEVFQGVQDNAARIHFVGFIQYELKSYLKRFGTSDLKHLQRYITRFDAAEKWYLSSNLETIFAHMIHKNEPALETLWQQANAASLAAQTWQRLSQTLPGFNKVPVWNEQDAFSRVIARGCWPLHPLAVWFLTRQRDLVQQRSALAFVKDITDRLSDETALVGERLRQVSAADLVHDFMLAELSAAEREIGGTVVETLQTLLGKHAARLDREQRLLLSGIAVLDKIQIGRQSQETVDALLGEATALDPTSVQETLNALAELGITEWNADLQQYELLTDGASRGQFQQWMRAQQQAMTANDVRHLFVRRGGADCQLGNITTDFDKRREIRTPDWFFEAQLAHVGIIENAISQAFDEWRKATLSNEAKGKVIYLYLHEQDDVLVAEQQIEARFAAELARGGTPRAPIWVILLEDRHGAIANHLARLAILDEKVSTAEQERLRRFIPDEQERSRSVLKETVEDALKEKRFWVAGFPEPPQDRLGVASREIFSAVYPQTVPFPFDGFGTANGTGVKDAAQLAKSLIVGEVSYAWIAARPVTLRNRIQAVLKQSWQAMNASGEPVAPGEPVVKVLYRNLEQAHQDDPQRSLLASYQVLLRPPYGFNASSASVMLGLLVGVKNPQRGIACGGVQMAPADWLEQVFPTKPGKHHLNESVLAQTTLRFFDDDAEARWRKRFDAWEAEERYDLKVRLAQEAERALAADPLPPSLEGTYRFLKSETDRVAVRLAEVQNRIRQWNSEIESAFKKSSIHHALKFGTKALLQGKEMQESEHWPQTLINDCNSLVEIGKEVVLTEVKGWIPRQTCHSASQVTEFRERTASESTWLEALGFTADAEALTRQAQRSIHRVEELQHYKLTLAECEDYPRQPKPRSTTPVSELRDEIKKGDDLIGTLQAIQALASEEKDAHIASIRQRQTQLKDAIGEREGELGKLYDIQLLSEAAVREVATTVERLRQIFVGTRDEGEIKDLATLLQRILTDVQSWDAGDTGVERLEQILRHQIAHQLSECRASLEQSDIEPPPQWDLDAIYQALAAERVDAARRRSAEWIRPRIATESDIQNLDLAGGAALERELRTAPGYLAESDQTKVARLLGLVEQRLETLHEVERVKQITSWQRPYREMPDIASLNHHAAEVLLHGLGHPPCPLKPEEQIWQRELSDRLTAHLDHLSIDDLVSRIERLSEPMRQALFERLSSFIAV